jgi:uncharacterized protein YyaL (SSP411 family)
MRRGGIYDHIGFGFHRYATDPAWFLPHFEKMLYDQAMLLWAYTEGYQATGNKAFAETAREIAAFVLRDLKSPEGGFYSALDADSAEGEGAYYQWKYSELEALLNPEELLLAEQLCGVSRQGNAHDEATGRTTGTNIIHLNENLAEYASRNNLHLPKAASLFESLRRTLFKARSERTPPGLDTKILTDWNALMIGALALAGRALDETDYIAEARHAADWILRTLYPQTGRLLHRYCKGQAGIRAHSDDYSFMIWGLMELYQATFEERYLLQAIELQQELDRHFSDEQSGAFFSTHEQTDDLPLRPLDLYDGALPSGNSVSALNLLRLGSLTGNAACDERARKIISAFGSHIQRMPGALCMLMCALEFEASRRTTITITGKHEAPDTLELHDAINHLFLPDTVVLFHADGHISRELARHLPDTAAHYPSGKAARAHVCCDKTCFAPVGKAEELQEILSPNND